MAKPFIPILAAFAAGIYLESIAGTDAVLLLFILCAALSGLIWSLRTQQPAKSALFIMFIFSVLGALSIYPVLFGTAGPDDVSRLAGPERVTLDGIVCEDPRVMPEKSELVISAWRIIKGASEQPVSGRVLLTVFDAETLPMYGDLIRAKVRLKTPVNFGNPGGFDYVRYLRLKGISVKGLVENSGHIAIIRHNQANPCKFQLEKFRAKLRGLIRRHAPSPHGEIIQAMILGEQSEIPRTVRDKFNQTGTSHVIAISGFNVGIIAGLAFFLIRALMKTMPAMLLRFDLLRVSALVAFVPIVIFAFIAGLGITTIRATLMLLALLISVLIGRERDLANTLALAGLLILVFSPQSLFDISFQLSFAAVASLLFMVPRLIEFVPPRIRGNRDGSPLKRALHMFSLFLIVTVSATVGTLPLIILYFNLLSLVIIPANILVVPILGYVVLVLGLAILIASVLWGPAAAFLIQVAAYLVSVSVQIVDWLGSLPFAWFNVSTPNTVEMLGFYAIVFLGLELMYRRKLARTDPENRPAGRRAMVMKAGLALCSAIILVDLSYNYLQSRGSGRLAIRVIDVGQGSASLIEFPGGKRILVDGGGFYDNSFDIGRYVVAPFLWRRKISSLDAVVLTHPHPDHVNGLPYIVDRFAVKEIWSNGQQGDLEALQELLRIAKSKGITCRVLTSRTPPLFFGGCVLTVLHPDESPLADDDPNDNSLMLKIRFDETSFLITGDITGLAETQIMHVRRDLQSDLMLVPHHGGRSSSSAAFLKQVRPKAALVSCGRDNLFQMPHPETLGRLKQINATVFRTDIHGAILAETDGRNLTVQTALTGN